MTIPERKLIPFCKRYRTFFFNFPNKIKYFYFFLIFCQYFAITLTASNNAVFFLTKGISVEWLAYLGTVSALTIVLFEFPTGLISDRFGNAISIFLSLMLRGGASIAVVACYGPVMFCFITVISSIGFTFFSGASDAWIFNKDVSA
jgi:MFS family permease